MFEVPVFRYVSTRGQSAPASPAQAILEGLAPDGGLYMPQAPLPPLAAQHSYAATAALCLQAAFFDSFSKERLLSLCEENYRAGRFDHPAITPLVPVGQHHVLELFHGPTASFKDLALSVLPGLMVMARDLLAPSQEILVLAATSGDTGSATMAGFKDLPGVKALVFYPRDGVSPVQKAQMQRMQGANLKAVAITGDFDQAQAGVKRLFARREQVAPGRLMSSANSINIGRLIPQMAYYLWAARQASFSHPPVYAVPTGNFGDIFAGALSRRAGLEAQGLLCATNANDVLKTALHLGVYDRRRPLQKTLSPSMDIVVSSNFERGLYLALNRDSQRLAPLMADLEREGVMRIPEDALLALRQEYVPYSCKDAEGLQISGQVFRQTGYLLDPHTAAAWHALTAHGIPGIALATASPYKFPEAALRALKVPVPSSPQEQMARLQQETGLPLPKALDGLFERPVLHAECIAPEAMEDFVKEALNQW